MNAPRSPKRKGFPPNLYQQPSGYFYYRNPQNGKIKGLGRDRAFAFQEARAANAVLATMAKSSLVAWVSGVEQLTFEAWVDKYEPLWIAEAKPADSTLASVKRHLIRLKKASFAHLAMQDITTKHVSDYLDELQVESTASMALNLRTRLSDIFRMAETRGMIATGKNPVTATAVPDYEVKRERLSLEQFLAIREAVPPWMQRAMNLALLTGQRREDITRMKFSDYRDGFLFVVQGKTGFKLQQDGRIGLLGMTIDDVIKSCRDRVVSQFLIHHQHTSGNYKIGEALSPKGLTQAFSIARDKIGIKATQEGRTPPSFHEIRSLAERLYKKEFGQEFAQAIMGHKHAKMTAEYDDLRGSGWNVVAAKAG